MLVVVALDFGFARVQNNLNSRNNLLRARGLNN